jgi:hypothetical protein
MKEGVMAVLERIRSLFKRPKVPVISHKGGGD